MFSKCNRKCQQFVRKNVEKRSNKCVQIFYIDVSTNFSHFQER